MSASRRDVKTAAGNSGPSDPAAIGPDLDVIFLDPAHGGADDGAHLPGGALEKDVTLAFALRLRDLLSGKGFKPVLTRSTSTEPGSQTISDDQRAELANRSNASACLLLHASNGGHGVHLYTSSLNVPAHPTLRTHLLGSSPVLPWDSAQSAHLADSIALRSTLAAAITGSRIPLVAGRASVHPIDSMLCPAVAIELAPYAPQDEAAVQSTDREYQQHVAESIVAALTFRRQQLQAAAGGTANGSAGHGKHAKGQSIAPRSSKPKLPIPRNSPTPAVKKSLTPFTAGVDR